MTIFAKFNERTLCEKKSILCRMFRASNLQTNLENLPIGILHHSSLVEIEFS